MGASLYLQDQFYNHDQNICMIMNKWLLVGFQSHVVVFILGPWHQYCGTTLCLITVPIWIPPFSDHGFCLPQEGSCYEFHIAWPLSSVEWNKIVEEWHATFIFSLFFCLPKEAGKNSFSMIFFFRMSALKQIEAVPSPEVKGKKIPNFEIKLWSVSLWSQSWKHTHSKKRETNNMYMVKGERVHAGIWQK